MNVFSPKYTFREYYLNQCDIFKDSYPYLHNKKKYLKNYNYKLWGHIKSEKCQYQLYHYLKFYLHSVHTKLVKGGKICQALKVYVMRFLKI